MGLKDRVAHLPVLGTALAVQDRYVRDAADPLAAAIGYFGFLSLFPLLALAVSVAGFVLDDPADQAAVARVITDALPGFEATLEDDEGEATVVEELVGGVVAQRGTIGVIGLVTLLIPGMKVINAAMTATRVVLRGEVVKGVGAKLRQLGALAGLGTIALLAAAAASLAGTGIGDLPGPLTVLLSVATTFGLDLLLFLGAYRLLSPSADFTSRELLPGALFAATGWMLLKVVGAAYVGAQVEQANAVYGALGGVIGLLLLLYLAGRLYLYGAELSAVRRERGDRAFGDAVAEQSAARSAEAGSDQRVAGTSGGGRGGSTVDGRPASDDDADDDTGDHAGGPPPVPRAALQPRPVDPGAAGRAPSVGEVTRQRSAVADAERPARARGRDLQRTVGIGLGAAALVVAWRWLGPDRQ